MGVVQRGGEYGDVAVRSRTPEVAAVKGGERERLRFRTVAHPPRSRSLNTRDIAPDATGRNVCKDMCDLNPSVPNTGPIVKKRKHKKCTPSECRS